MCSKCEPDFAFAYSTDVGKGIDYASCVTITGKVANCFAINPSGQCEMCDAGYKLEYTTNKCVKISVPNCKTGMYNSNTGVMQRVLTLDYLYYYKLTGCNECENNFVHYKDYNLALVEVGLAVVNHICIEKEKVLTTTTITNCVEDNANGGL